MIISPEANETEIDAASARVAGFIADRGGLVYDQDYWGLRRLAYPIQKFHEGNYVLTRFALEPAEVIELDSSLKASDDVMRHLTMKLDKSVKVEPPEPEPEEEAPEEPVAQAEAEAEDAAVAQTEEAGEETPDAPVAQAEAAEPVAQAEAPAEPVAQAEEAAEETPDAPVAQVETEEGGAEAEAGPQAEAEAEAPSEPATEEERPRPEGESP